MNYSRGNVVLFPYPFGDLVTKKVRPAVVVGEQGSKYNSLFIVPLTSRLNNLADGEFVLEDWETAGLNVQTAVKRGCYLADCDIVKLKVGSLSENDMEKVNSTLKQWLELK